MARPKWRRPLQLPKSSYDDFVNARSILSETGELPGIRTECPEVELENFYAITRWTQSRKLTVAVTAPAVQVLSCSVFDDIRIDELYFPEGCDCFQIVAEERDPILRENLIFMKPDKVYDKYFLRKGCRLNQTRDLGLMNCECSGKASAEIGRAKKKSDADLGCLQKPDRRCLVGLVSG